MSVAEKLRAEGRVEGRQEGLLVGKIQMLEEILGRGSSSAATLEDLSLAELEAKCAELRREYESGLKTD